MLKIYPAETITDINSTKELFNEYLEYLKVEFHKFADMPWFIEY